MEGWGMYTVELYQRISSGLPCRGDEYPESGSGVRSAPGDGEEDAAVLDPAGLPEPGERVRPKLGPYTGVIEQILERTRSGRPSSVTQRCGIYQRLKDEHGFTGGYTIVKDYVREQRVRGQEMFVPLVHPPGDARGFRAKRWSRSGR